MTPEAQLALIGNLVIIFITIGSIIVNVVNAIKSTAKLDHIMVLTNSTLTEANDRIKKLAEVINQLTKEQPGSKEIICI